MKIQNDDDLYIEIGAARVLMRTLTRGLYEIDGHEDEHGWFIPDDTTKNRYIFSEQFTEWMELTRAIFDKLDEADAYLTEKLCAPKNKKAANAPTNQSEALTATEAPANGYHNQHTTKTEKAQEGAG